MDYVTSGYVSIDGGSLGGNATTTTTKLTIGGNCSTTTWIPAPYYQWPYYPTYWPTYYPNNEAALREAIREKDAVIEEMRELVKMQRRLLDAILPKGSDA